MKSTEILWQIQFRTGRDRPWRNRAGLFETRMHAREVAKILRDWTYTGAGEMPANHGYGFGNTRVIKYVKGRK